MEQPICPERSELRGLLYAFPVLKNLGSTVEVVSAGLLGEGFVGSLFLWFLRRIFGNGVKIWI
jgi:hypothetical protein